MCDIMCFNHRAGVVVGYWGGGGGGGGGSCIEGRLD